MSLKVQVKIRYVDSHIKQKFYYDMDFSKAKKQVYKGEVVIGHVYQTFLPSLRANILNQ